MNGSLYLKKLNTFYHIEDPFQQSASYQVDIGETVVSYFFSKEHFAVILLDRKTVKIYDNQDFTHLGTYTQEDNIQGFALINDYHVFAVSDNDEIRIISFEEGTDPVIDETIEYELQVEKAWHIWQFYFIFQPNH